MNHIPLLVAVVALLWWILRPRGGSLASVSVRGGSVAIDASSGVEERRVWRYVGETTRLSQAFNARSGVTPAELPLVHMAIYDVIPVAPIQGEPIAPTKDRPDGLIGYVLVGFPNGIPRGRWVMSWEPVVLTVQEQLAGALRIVPNAFRPDDTEIV